MTMATPRPKYYVVHPPFFHRIVPRHASVPWECILSPHPSELPVKIITIMIMMSMTMTMTISMMWKPFLSCKGHVHPKAQVKPCNPYDAPIVTPISIHIVKYQRPILLVPVLLVLLLLVLLVYPPYGIDPPWYPVAIPLPLPVTSAIDPIQSHSIIPMLDHVPIGPPYLCNSVLSSMKSVVHILPDP